jgi:hypothetical protein
VVLRCAIASIAACLAGGCADEAPTLPEGDTFIALSRDFDGFTEWNRFAVAGEAIPTDAAPGPAVVYARTLPPPGVARFPIGTILIKTIEPEDPTLWTIHAMVKRSQTFNPEGAIGWEYFELALTPDEEIVILWRGEGPPSGHGYGSVGEPTTIPLVCNDCHAPAWTNDGVLTPVIRLLGPEPSG